MTCLNKIRDALLTVTDRVYHFQALKKDAPYIVWAEDGAGEAVFANGTMCNQVITGTVDLYTRTPDDWTIFVAIQNALSGVCAWKLNSVQHEEDTGLTHYEWVWEVS